MTLCCIAAPCVSPVLDCIATILYRLQNRMLFYIAALVGVYLLLHKECLLAQHCLGLHPNGLQQGLAGAVG